MDFENNYVKTKYGWVHGEKDEWGNHVFKGIPYALPPVGKRRFHFAEQMIPWTGVRESIQYGAEAVQTDEGDFRYRSEDCLYLNIWSPAVQEEEKLPVFVWIHGGAFLGGAGSDPMYRGEHLAMQGIVVVTINYRLGVLGFLAHGEVETAAGCGGNLGIMDQIMALRWVKENIGCFGGNPEDITVGGQSAGSGSVGMLLASELTEGLFHRAIMQSGPIFGFLLAPKTYKQMTVFGQEFVEEYLDGKIRKLYELSAQTLNELANKYVEDKGLGLLWAPIVDGFVVKEHPEKIFREGRQRKVEILAGCTEDEFISDYDAEELKEGISKQEYEILVDSIAADYPELCARFPYEGKKASLYQYSKLKAAVMLENTKEMLLENNKVEKKGYCYLFKKCTSDKENLYLCPHSAELPYLFGKENKGGRFPWYDSEWKKEDYEMSAALQKTWGDFIKSGKPGEWKNKEWKSFNDKDDVMIIDG